MKTLLRSEKGYALLMALLFVVVSALMSVGLYAYAYHVHKQTAIEDIVSARDYYAELGGLRYAYILLKDPGANFVFDADGKATKTITDADVLWEDLNLAGRNLIITVEEYRSDNPDNASYPTWKAGTYKVTCEFET